MSAVKTPRRPGESPKEWAERVLKAHGVPVGLQAAGLAHPKVKPPRCFYCGNRTAEHLIVCHAHSDLPALDPVFALSALSSTGPDASREGAEEVAA